MISRRVLVAWSVVCLSAGVASAVQAQTLAAAAEAARKRREAAASQPQAPAPATEDAKPLAAGKGTASRKVYTEADLPGRTPADLARSEELRALDARYDDLLARMQNLKAKMDKDARAAKSAELELKVFKLDTANRNKFEKRKALEDDLARSRAVVQENLVVLDKLKAEGRALDAELERVRQNR